MKKKVFTILVAVLLCVLMFGFSGCDLFASEYKKGINLAKKASNVEVTKISYTRNSEGTIASNLVGTVQRTIHECDGGIVVKLEQFVDSNSGKVSKETRYWYAKVGEKYIQYTQVMDVTKDEVTELTEENITKEVYDEQLGYLNTGDVVSSIEFYDGKEQYTFGFITEDDVKDFRVIWGGRSVVQRWGFKDKKLIYKTTTSNGIYEYTYDPITLPDNSPVPKG